MSLLLYNNFLLLNYMLKLKRDSNRLTLKETFMMKDPKYQKTLSKILPDSFKIKNENKKNKEKFFIKK